MVLELTSYSVANYKPAVKTVFFYRDYNFLFQEVPINMNHVCDFKVQFSAGTLTVTSMCDSQMYTVLEWTDRDPLDIAYYYFGSWDVKSEFHVDEGMILIFKLFSCSVHNVDI